MKFSQIVSLACTAILLSGCVPHTTGKTEVGVRTKKTRPVGRERGGKPVLCPGLNHLLPADHQ